MTTDDIVWKLLPLVLNGLVGILVYFSKRAFENMEKALEGLKVAVTEGDKAIALLGQRVDRMEADLADMKRELHEMRSRS